MLLKRVIVHNKVMLLQLVLIRDMFLQLVLLKVMLL